MPVIAAANGIGAAAGDGPGRAGRCKHETNAVPAPQVLQGGPPDGGQTGSLLGTGGPPSSRGVSPAISRFFPSPKRKVCTMDCEKCRRDMTSQLRIDQESQLNLALSAPCSRKSSAAANGKPRTNSPQQIIQNQPLIGHQSSQ